MSSIADAEHYDLISLGFGEAGKYIAWIEGSKGKRRAVIERKWLGGSCPKVACLPSKHVNHSAKLFAAHGDRLLQGYSEDEGLTPRRAHMREVKRRKEDMVNGLMAMHDGSFKENDVDLIWGNGKIIGPQQLEVIDIHGKKEYCKEMWLSSAPDQELKYLRSLG